MYKYNFLCNMYIVQHHLDELKNLLWMYSTSQLFTIFGLTLYTY